ncbi:hypothetical protein QE152_g7811 [Popillia japonica]|uniref:Uncharacterized protein n=1 Tax=Popillia japonica TaxID=7064 RepID=A0AAW1MDF3_POPJA
MTILKKFGWIESPTIVSVTFQIKNYIQECLFNFSNKKLHSSGNHFLSACKGRKFLLQNALPTINLPGFHEVPTIENSFYRNVDSQKIEQPLEKNSIAQSTVIESDTFTKITATYSTNMENQPSTSTGFITDKGMKAIPSTLTNRATTKMHLPEEVTEMYKFAVNYRRHEL